MMENPADVDEWERNEQPAFVQASSTNFTTDTLKEDEQQPDDES